MVETAVKENQEAIAEVVVSPMIDGFNGRDNKGQFAQGNSLSVGNRGPIRKAKELKTAMLNAVTAKDMAAIVKKLIKQAKKGDVPAIKELFDRCLGKPLQTHEVDVEVRTYTQEQCDSIRKMLAGRCVNANS